MAAATRGEGDGGAKDREDRWYECSGGAALAAAAPRSYHELRTVGWDDDDGCGGRVIDRDSLEHINMDVPRTSGFHPRFALEPDCVELSRADRTPAELAAWLRPAPGEQRELVTPLIALLGALCARSPERGYTQGMNFVCALLLLHMGEERAFWVAVAIQDELFPGLWDEPERAGRRIELQIAAAALERRLPAAARVLSPIDIGAWATGWVDTLFAGSWPPPVAARCMDLLLCGEPRVNSMARLIVAYRLRDIMVMIRCLG
jgi:hypothetical protein